MMTKEGSTKIVNFMTPGAGVLLIGRGHISHIEKIHYFFKNLFLYSHGARVLVLGCGRVSHIAKYIISFKIFFSTQGQR